MLIYFLILQAHNKQDFPGWTTIVTCISHFMLVINSSTNMILYIFLNAAFRKHFMELVGVIGKWICCFRNKERASVSSKRRFPLGQGKDKWLPSIYKMFAVY